MNRTLLSGERQVAAGVDGIRRDHVARYEWAAANLPHRWCSVIDFACGVGYGARLIADRGEHSVVGFDASAEAIAYANEHYAGKGTLFHVLDAESDTVATLPGFDVAICFETIEHVRDPSLLLRSLRAPLLFASVPNEAVFPYTGQPFHHQHYTRAEFEQLLTDCGWQVTAWFGQADHLSEVEPDVDGRTLIARAVRA